MTPRKAWVPAPEWLENLCVRSATGLITVVILAVATLVAGNIGGTASLAQESKKLLPRGVTQQMRPKRYLTTMQPLAGASLTEYEVRSVAAYVLTLTR